MLNSQNLDISKTKENSLGLYLHKWRYQFSSKSEVEGLWTFLANGNTHQRYTRDYRGSFQLSCRFISRLIYVNGRSCLAKLAITCLPERSNYEIIRLADVR